MDPELTPQRVIEELGRTDLDAQESFDRWNRIERETPMRYLIGALRIARTPAARRSLLDLLGFRMARSAIPDIIGFLDDPNRKVRAAAADALGKAFGYPDRPPPPDRMRDGLTALLRRWDLETRDGIRATVLRGLALVGDPSVRPLLVAAQNDPNEMVRGQAHWGLGYLDGLEKEGYSRRRFAWAHTPPPGWEKHDYSSSNGQSPE